MFERTIPGELVYFLAEDGVKLQGFLVSGKRRSRKAIIHVHGLTGNFYRGNFQRETSRTFASRGWDFFSINTRGRDLMTWLGTGKKDILGGTAVERFEDCIFDIKGAVKFLRKRGYKIIVLQGHSTGCQKIVHYVDKTSGWGIHGLVLLSPADDYNFNKKIAGVNFSSLVTEARKHKKSNLLLGKHAQIIERPVISAGRFLSLTDTSMVEARIFNYESQKLEEFSRVTKPILAVFGEKEQYRTKPVRKYLEKLKRETGSRKFSSLIIKDANHSFKEREQKTARKVIAWLEELT